MISSLLGHPPSRHRRALMDSLLREAYIRQRRPSAAAPLTSIVTAQRADEMVALAQRLLGGPAADRPATEPIVDVSFPGIRRRASIGFEPSPDGSTLHVVELEDQLSCSAEKALFYDVNSPCNDPSLSFHRLISHHSDPSLMVLYSHTKTKPFLFFSPRQVVSIRVIKRLQRGHFVDICQSVEVLDLHTHPSISPLYLSTKDQLCSTHYAVNEWRTTALKDGACLSSKRSLVKHDPKLGVALGLVRSAMANFFRSNARDFGARIESFYAANGGTGLWFEGDDIQLSI